MKRGDQYYNRHSSKSEIHDISKLIGFLNNTQKEGVLIKFTHFDRKENTTLSTNQKGLDSLARLVGGPSVGAACFDGERLLFSSNDNINSTAGYYFSCLKKIARDNSDDKPIEDLKEKAYTEAKANWRKPVGRNNAPRIEITINNLDSFIRNISLSSRDEDIIIQFRKELNNLDLRNASLTAEKILQKGIIKNNSGLKTAVEDVYRTRQDINRVLDYVRNNGEHFKHDYKFILADMNVHAEMSIIDQLIKDRRLAQGAKFYIGDSKLCCASCQITLDVVNKKYGSQV